MDANPKERTLDECLRVANESRTGVIRRGTYNLKYAKGFAHSQHTISTAQQHKHQGQQQRDSVQSTNDLFCSFFVLFFFGILLFSLVCKVLQASCSQRPLIRQRTFTLWFSFFLSLSFLFPFPYPLPIADAVALTMAMRCLSVHCELWTRQGNKSRSVIC